MKRYESSTIKAMGRDISGYYLMTHSETIEGVKAEIDAANERAKAHGYKAEQYLITCVETYCWREDDGTFIKREIIESVIEAYPANI